MISDALCTQLPWDSTFWGFPVARVNTMILRDGMMGAVNKWCGENAIQCLYLLADGSDSETLWRAAEAGFRFVDIRIDLERPLPVEIIANGSPSEVRPIAKEDVKSLQQIAQTAHQDSRFFKDQNFNRELCAELYAAWIMRDFKMGSVHGYFQQDSEKPVGYVTFSVQPDNDARIGLIAIKETQRGKGAGWKLLSSAMESASRQGANKLRVATQGTNLAALNLYEKGGFRIYDVKIWFHKWFSLEDNKILPRSLTN